MLVKLAYLHFSITIWGGIANKISIEKEERDYKRQFVFVLRFFSFFFILFFYFIRLSWKCTILKVSWQFFKYFGKIFYCVLFYCHYVSHFWRISYSFSSRLDQIWFTNISARKFIETISKNGCFYVKKNEVIQHPFIYSKSNFVIIIESMTKFEILNNL